MHIVYILKFDLHLCQVETCRKCRVRALLPRSKITLAAIYNVRSHGCSYVEKVETGFLKASDRTSIIREADLVGLGACPQGIVGSINVV